MKFFLFVLGVVLIALKLTDDITLSWLWVLAPMWIPVAILTIYYAVGYGIIRYLLSGSPRIYPRRFV